MRLIDLLEISAARDGRGVAIKGQRLELTYGRMRDDALLLAEALRGAGCREGVKAAIIFDNCAEYLVNFFAVSAAGGTIVPLHRRMKAYEMRRYIDAADVSMVITSARAARELGETKAAIVTVEYEAAGQLEVRSVGGCAGECDAADGDVALMVPTSGTTGDAKIVMLTDEQLISNMRAYLEVAGFGGHNVVYCAIPMHHIYCICAQILTHISRGDTFVARGGPFFIRDFVSAVKGCGVTGAALVPFMAAQLAEFPEAEDLAGLEFITLSGSRTPVAVYRRLAERYGRVRFMNTYGMSEAGSRISIAGPRPGDFPVESVGRPLPGVVVRIAGEGDTPLPPGCEGEIQVRSSGVMKGYYKQPELTKETMVDGWLRTGDIGRVDDKGNILILGRKKKIIVTGGENVYPEEVEECLLEHEDVKEAAVVGRDDGILGEVPVAFVAGKNGQRQTAELMKFCGKRLSSHKVPRAIEWLDALPKTDTLKTDRRKLERMAQEGRI